MSAAHVKLIVRHPRSRNVIGDRGQTVAQVRARGHRDFVAADDGGGRHLLRVHGQSALRDGDLLAARSDHELEMQNGSASRRDHDLLDGRREAILAHRHEVRSYREGSRFEASIGVGGELLRVVRAAGLHHHFRSLDRAMVGIVNHAADRPENRGPDRGCARIKKTTIDLNGALI